MLEGFVHPAFAGLAALAAVPLIIHLLNRQRHKPVRWAAMRFVLAAYRKTRRRVQIENLLLLLLRMAAVALLAFAIARPFAAGDGALGKLTEARRDLVLVLDGSASTGYSTGVETVFERIVGRATELVEDLEGSNTNRAYVILAGSHPRLLSWPSPAKASSVLATLQTPLDEGLDLGAALGEVRRLAEEEAAGTARSSLEVHLLTDMQRGAFLLDIGAPSGAAPEPTGPAEPAAASDAGAPDADPDSGAAAGLYEQLTALEDMGIVVQVEDLGPDAQNPPNLGIADLALVGDPGGGIPLEVAVTVANRGTAPIAGVRVGLSIDGNRQPSQRVDIEPRATVVALFRVPAGLRGAHSLTADLEGDALAADDRRSSVVVLPDPVRLLLVNGAPNDRFESDAVAFLELALAAPEFGAAGDGGSAASPTGNQLDEGPFDVEVAMPSALASGEIEFADYDVIWLADVAPLTAAVIESLTERIAAGGSLILSMGDHVGNAGKEGRGLFLADGTGLLPAELGRKVSTASQDDYFQVETFDATHPALAFYGDESLRRLLTQVPILQFLLARPVPGARVLATLNDDGASPLLIERPFGAGRTILWTTTINPDWTYFAGLGKTFVPFVIELVRYAGRAEATDRNYAPGATPRLELTEFPRSPELVRPDETRRSLDGDPESTAAGTWNLPPLDPSDTRRAGLYAIDLESGAAEPFAVQLDPEEGDLARIGPTELDNLHNALEPARPSQKGGANQPRSQGEIWRWLAILCLAALVAESLFGAWLGSKRRVVR